MYSLDNEWTRWLAVFFPKFEIFHLRHRVTMYATLCGSTVLPWDLGKGNWCEYEAPAACCDVSNKVFFSDPCRSPMSSASIYETVAG